LSKKPVSKKKIFIDVEKIEDEYFRKSKNPNFGE